MFEIKGFVARCNVCPEEIPLNEGWEAKAQVHMLGHIYAELDELNARLDKLNARMDELTRGR